jgi:hypothetical protein
MSKTLSKNKIIGAIKLQLFSLFLTIFVIMFFINNKSKNAINFFHFGKATQEIPINIFGINIDTDFKYLLIMFWIIIIEAINTWSYKIYKNWYRNIIVDPKSKKIGMTNKNAIIIINMWECLVFIPKIFKWLLLMKTGQLQFIIPQFIVRRLVSNYIDSKYLLEKK